jgi:hypothetical protein
MDAGNSEETLRAVSCNSCPSSREVIVRYWVAVPAVHRPNARRWALPAQSGHWITIGFAVNAEVRAYLRTPVAEPRLGMVRRLATYSILCSSSP